MNIFLISSVKPKIEAAIVRLWNNCWPDWRALLNVYTFCSEDSPSLENDFVIYLQKNVSAQKAVEALCKSGRQMSGFFTDVVPDVHQKYPFKKSRSFALGPGFMRVSCTMSFISSYIVQRFIQVKWQGSNSQEESGKETRHCQRLSIILTIYLSYCSNNGKTCNQIWKAGGRRKDQVLTILANEMADRGVTNRP